MSNFSEENLDDDKKEELDEDIKDLMKNHDLDKDEAEHVQEIIDETGLDEDCAVELKDIL